MSASEANCHFVIYCRMERVNHWNLSVLSYKGQRRHVECKQSMILITVEPDSEVSLSGKWVELKL